MYLPLWEYADRIQQKGRVVSLVCWLPGAAVTDDHRWGGLKQQKFIVSQLWRLEVQNQAVGRLLLPPKALGKNAQ